jgi:putative sterol carrier protein
MTMSEKLGNTMKEILEKVEQVISTNPDPISGINLKYQFEISGEYEGTYLLELQEGKPKFIQGNESPADCTLIMSFDSFRKFLTGRLSGTMAFMTGNLKIKGDITKALKLETLLKQYIFSE